MVLHLRFARNTNSWLLEKAFDKSDEHRVGFVGAALELWVILASQHEWVIDAFDNFYEAVVWVHARCADTPGIVLGNILVVRFVTVSVSLYDVSLAICFGGQGALLKVASVITQAHSAASAFLALLAFHGRDYWVFGLGVDFLGMRACQTCSTSSGDYKHVHTVTKS